jgi:hypothetical protein
VDKVHRQLLLNGKHLLLPEQSNRVTDVVAKVVAAAMVLQQVPSVVKTVREPRELEVAVPKAAAVLRVDDRAEQPDPVSFASRSSRYSSWRSKLTLCRSLARVDLKRGAHSIRMSSALL